MMEQKEPMTYLAFYQKYYIEVLRYLIQKCGSLSDAEELAKDIFLYCWKHFEQYDAQKASYRSWLYVIVLSRYKNYCRDKKGWNVLDEFIDVLPADKSDVEKAVFLEEKRMLLAHALVELPCRERDILILRFWKNKTSEQIARLMHLTPTNVRQIQKRALRKLQGMLSE